jgi:hypothetical protein
MVNGCFLVTEKGERAAKKRIVEISAFLGVEMF